jgi:hypothetical protein
VEKKERRKKKERRREKERRCKVAKKLEYIFYEPPSPFLHIKDSFNTFSAD